MNIFCVVVVMKNSRIALFLSSLMFLSSNNSMAVEKIHSSQKTKIKNSSQKTKVKNARTKKLKKIETKESPKLKNLSGKSVHLNSDMNVKIKESKKENFKAGFRKISDKVIDYVCEHPVSTPFKVAGGLLGTKIIYDLASGLIGDKQKMKSYLRDKYKDGSTRYPVFSLARTLVNMFTVRKERTEVICAFLDFSKDRDELCSNYIEIAKNSDRSLKLSIISYFITQFVIGRYKMAGRNFESAFDVAFRMFRNKLRDLSIEETMFQCAANVEIAKFGSCFEYTFVMAHLLCELGINNYICKCVEGNHFYNIFRINDSKDNFIFYVVDLTELIVNFNIVNSLFEFHDIKTINSDSIVSKPLNMDNIKDKMSTLFTNDEVGKAGDLKFKNEPDLIIKLIS